MTVVRHRNNDVTVKMSGNAYRVLCGLVQGEEKVNLNGICSSAEVWSELQNDLFPFGVFQREVHHIDNEGGNFDPPEGITTYYDSEAGY